MNSNDASERRDRWARLPEQGADGFQGCAIAQEIRRRRASEQM